MKPKFDPSGFELMTSRSWQYIPCHWDACSNHSAISDFHSWVYIVLSMCMSRILFNFLKQQCHLLSHCPGFSLLNKYATFKHRPPDMSIYVFKTNWFSHTQGSAPKQMWYFQTLHTRNWSNTLCKRMAHKSDKNPCRFAYIMSWEIGTRS